MHPVSASGESRRRYGSPVPAVEVRAQLGKVLDSVNFIKSVRLSRFLRFTVERTLEEQAGSLKEFTLGKEVFDRRADYDPRTDSIVRVEAQRLRRKLNEYYTHSGRHDAVLIAFQPGSYVPAFSWRRAPELLQGTLAAAAVAPDLDPNTIAVLPFTNLSPDPEQLLFCDGTTEEIIHKLTTIRGLKVLGLTTMFTLRESKEGPLATCRKLGVGTVIEGSVRSSGNRLRISAKAVAVKTGRTLWSHRFDRRVDDIFAIQDEIAHQVAVALQAPERGAPAAPSSRPAVKAYTLYLKGWHIWDDGTRERCLAAVGYFNEAVSLAPDFALPHSGLANAYQWMATWGWMRPRNAEPKSRYAAMEALRIDSHSAEAYAGLAATRLRFDWDWNGATAAADKALELNPGCSLAHSMKANCALAQSSFEAALVHFERALQLDPLSSRTNGALGIAYWVMGEVRQAERWLHVSEKLNPRSLLPKFFLALLYLSTGQYAEALEESQPIGEGSTSHLLLGAHGSAQAGMGRREEALHISRRLEDCSRLEYVDPLATTIIQVGLGDIDGAFASLHKAVEERSPLAAFLHVNPTFQALRADPRFQVLRSMLKLG